jgi:hypothetical protein
MKDWRMGHGAEIYSLIQEIVGGRGSWNPHMRRSAGQIILKRDGIIST